MVVLVLAGGIFGWWVQEWRQAVILASVPLIDSGPTLEQIQTLADLTTLKVNVADAIVTELAGKTGGIKVVLVVHGSVTLGVDLSKARFESVDQQKRRAILILPAPKIESVSFDQKRTKIVAFWESGLWILIPGERDADAVVTDLSYREAEQIVVNAASDPDLTARSRIQTEVLLARFLSTIDWAVQILWVSASCEPQPRSHLIQLDRHPKICRCV